MGSLETLVCLVYLALLDGMDSQVALVGKVMLDWTANVTAVRKEQRASQDSKGLQASLEHVDHLDPSATRANEVKMVRWEYPDCQARRECQDNQVGQVLRVTKVMLLWPTQDHQAPRVMLADQGTRALLDRREREASLDAMVFKAFLVLGVPRDREV